MKYHKFSFLIRGETRPLCIEVVAIDLAAAHADVVQAFGEDVEIITVGCSFA